MAMTRSTIIKCQCSDLQHDWQASARSSTDGRPNCVCVYVAVAPTHATQRTSNHKLCRHLYYTVMVEHGMNAMHPGSTAGCYMEVDPPDIVNVCFDTCDISWPAKQLKHVDTRPTVIMPSTGGRMSHLPDYYHLETVSDNHCTGDDGDDAKFAFSDDS